MKKQILIAGVFLSSLIVGCTQDEALDSISNEVSVSNEIKKVETLFAGNIEEGKNESEYSDEGEKIETNMSIEDRLVYYDYISRNGINNKPIASFSPASRSWAGGSGLVLKPKGVKCFPYDELILYMDCEDHKEKSYTSGNTGETFVDSNGNVHFFFCIVPQSLTYGGGLNQYHTTFKRFFDCEDSDNDNRLYINGIRMQNNIINNTDLGITGDGRGNITFHFNLDGSNNDGYGRFGGRNGTDPSEGIIHTDDEDNNNQNSYSPFVAFPPSSVFIECNHNTTMKVNF